MSIFKSKTAKGIGLATLIGGYLIWAKKAYSNNGNTEKPDESKPEASKPYTWGDKINILEITNDQVVIARYGEQTLRVNKNNQFKVPAQNAVIRANMQGGKAVGLKVQDATTNKVLAIINR